MSKTIAILGCGPSGLLACHAAVLRGLDPVIYSKKIKSPIYAAMFLHRPIPGIHYHNFGFSWLPRIHEVQPELRISVIKSGCKEGYAENVYGDPTHPVSWDKFEDGEIGAWNLKSAYDWLWDQYCDRIRPWDLSRRTNIKNLLERYDIRISTIPRPVLCHENHAFRSQKIWVAHGPGNHLVEGVNDGDVMYYNGYTPNMKYGMIGPKWYRFSQINRYQSWEYSRLPEDPGYGERVISEGYKPIATNCDCHPEIIKLGRFGAWEKQILTHHVFETALRICEADHVV